MEGSQTIVLRAWCETAVVVVVMSVFWLLARRCSRLPSPWWTLGYIIPFMVLGVILLAGHGYPGLMYQAPVSALFAGRTEFVIMGATAIMLLVTPMPRLTFRRQRFIVGVFLALVLLQISVLPFLAPAFNQRELAAIKTRINIEGVCLQSTHYTCGPAAAVTGLRRLGLAGDEGEIARLAGTSSSMGTPPDILAAALRLRYASEGLLANDRPFHHVSELRGLGPTLAVVKFTYFLDHYVTVLEVTDNEVVVGDPMSGLSTLSHEEFRAKWRFLGVVLNRSSIALPGIAGKSGF
jgi:predicted double-glycine peptidase